MKMWYLLLISFTLALCTTTAFGASVGGNEFVISFWCAPPNTEPMDARYKEVSQAGFNITMPPCGATTVKDNLAILDVCRKYGMKTIIGDDRIMAKEPSDPEFEKNLDAVIADYAKHPAFYGYHLTDEPNAGAFPKLAAINQYLLKKDPAHLPFINLLPTYGNGAMWGTPTYEEHVEQFMAAVKPKLLSYDHYALFEKQERGDYFQNMEIIRAAALKYNNTPWMNIILATPHFGYRNPSEGDLRWQVYTTLAYGGTGIAYFTYWTLTGYENFRNAIMEAGGKPTEHYEMVKKLNAEMKALAPILLKLKSVGVYHTGTLPTSTRALPETGTPVKSVEGAEIIIGQFEGPKSSCWVMFTNRDMRKAADATITFAQANLVVKEVDKQTGKLVKINVDSKAKPAILKLKFEPGEGRLFFLIPTKQEGK